MPVMERCCHHMADFTRVTASESEVESSSLILVVSTGVGHKVCQLLNVHSVVRMHQSIAASVIT